MADFRRLETCAVVCLHEVTAKANGYLIPPTVLAGELGGPVMDSFVAHSNFALLFFVFAAGCESLAGKNRAGTEKRARIRLALSGEIKTVLGAEESTAVLAYPIGFGFVA